MAKRHLIRGLKEMSKRRKQMIRKEQARRKKRKMVLLIVNQQKTRNYKASRYWIPATTMLVVDTAFISQWVRHSAA